jgi:hypothetical protein
MPATKMLAETITASSMCASRHRNDGLKMTSIQLLGSYRPLRNTNPAGVCIHELLAMIQTDDRTVPMETITVAANIVARPTRPSPYSRMPMNPASTKNAVTTSIPRIGPMMGPVCAAKMPQLSPSSKVTTMPATTPSAKPTAKMRRQKRNIWR